MKLRSLIFSTILAGSLFANANAADVSNSSSNSVAFVNVQEVMRDSTAAKSVKSQLDDKQKSFQAELSKKEDALHKEEESLGKQKSVLSPDAFSKKVKEFQAKANAAQKDVQGKKAELDNAFSSALGEIQKSVLDITSSVAKEKGYTVVVQASSLLYADPKLDITKDVLAKLNAALPKVTVSFKSAASNDE